MFELLNVERGEDIRCVAERATMLAKKTGLPVLVEGPWAEVFPSYSRVGEPSLVRPDATPEELIQRYRESYPEFDPNQIFLPRVECAA